MTSARDDCKACDLPTRRTVAVDQPQDAASVQSFIEKHPRVKYIRLHWVDLSGFMRTRMIPKERGLQIAQGKGRYVLAQTCMIIPILPARPPQDVSFMIGFEIEFVLLNEDLKIAKPFDSLASYSMLAGLRGKTLDIAEEIIEALEASGISIYHVHSEATEQLEIALSPGAPMQDIDNFMYAQEIIEGAFMRHGLRATLSPRPVSQSSTQNGVHLHLSSTKEGVLRSILAGALRKMETLCAFSMANVDSYVHVISDGRDFGSATAPRIAISLFAESTTTISSLDLQTPR